MIAVSGVFSVKEFNGLEEMGMRVPKNFSSQSLWEFIEDFFQVLSCRSVFGVIQLVKLLDFQLKI